MSNVIAFAFDIETLSPSAFAPRVSLPNEVFSNNETLKN
jgi:hypothetical protein